MEDSYGDGWNGASIDVEVNGANVANVTIDSGSEGTASISTYSNDIVDFIFTGGTWDSEITFQIYDPSGSEIFNGAAPSVDGNFLTSTSNSNCDPPNCMPPSFFTSSNLTAGAIDISWTSPDNSTYSNIEYGEEGFSLGNGNIDSSSNNTFSIEGLSPITTYDVYIQAVCDVNDVSEWAGPFSFTTPCAALTPPQLEDFELGFPPNDCWDVANNGDPSTGPTEIGSSTWLTDGFGNVGTTGAVKINLYTTGKNDWVLSPQYDLSSEGPFQVEFDFGVFTYFNTTSGTLGSDDEVQVLITRDGGVQWDTLARYDNTYITSPGGDHIVLTLPEDDGIVQFAIWATEGSVYDTEDNDVIFDNFAVNEIPSCPTLSNIIVTNITTSDANIEWTPGNSDSLWLISYGYAGYNLNDSVQTSLETNSILLENLEDNTAYDFYVQGICQGGDTNTLQGPISFTTFPEGICGAYTLELFDSFGDGWNGAGIDVIINGNFSETITLNTGSGPQTFEVLAIEGEIVEFSFTSGTYDNEISLIITDPNNYEIYNGDAPDVGIFTNPIESCPSCSQPQNISAFNITSESSTFTWNSIATDSLWVTYLTPSGVDPSDTYQTIVGNDTIVFNDLTPNTEYDFYLVEVCGINDSSLMLGPYSIITPCISLDAFPYLEEFSTWPPNCWNLSGGSEICTPYNNSAAQANLYNWPAGSNAIMTSPIFDVSSLVSPELLFDWSHLLNSFYPDDALEVFVSEDYGTNWVKIWFKTGEDFESNDGASYNIPGAFISSGRLNLASFENSIMVRFNFISTGYGSNCFIDNVEIKEAPMNDIGVTNVQMSLASSGCEIAVSPLTVTVQNYGIAPQTQFSVDYTLNDIPFSEFIFDTIQGGDSLVYTFSNEIDMSEDGNYEFIFSTNLENDIEPANNSYEALNFENFYSPPSVEGTHDTVCCVGDVAILTATGPEDVTIDWFDSIGGNVIASGNTFITPPLNTSTTYWAAYLDTYSSNVGPTDNNIGNGGVIDFNNGEGLVFDVLNEISLDSVTIYTEELEEVSLNISNTSIGFSENINYEITGDLPFNGEIKIPIGIELEPAENYTITLNNPEGGLYRNTTGVNFPYTSNGNISIKGSTIGTDFYFFFYNWEISSLSCYSKHKEVIAYIDGIWGINKINALDFSVVPNPNNGFFEIITNRNIGPNTNLTVTDITGKVVTREKLLTNNYQVDLSGIEKGVYIINVSNKSAQSQKRVVIH
jgi:hypothetical protein